jgi:uncharacterized protein (TIGR02284 family)
VGFEEEKISWSQVFMSNNQVIAILNDLIQTCLDSQEGFRTAAERVCNSEFRRLFNIFAQQRNQFVTELQAEVNRLGGEPIGSKREKPSSWSLERGWKAAKSIVAKGDEASIVAGCQRGEEAAVRGYQQALNADLPLDVQYVVKRQYMDIKDAYDRMRILQRAA